MVSCHQLVGELITKLNMASNQLLAQWGHRSTDSGDLQQDEGGFTTWPLGPHPWLRHFLPPERLRGPVTAPAVGGHLNELVV